MKVLVTGATGLTGSHTVAALLEAGHEVRTLVRNAAKAETVLRPHGIGPEAVEHTTGDVTDEASVERALEGCEAVVHSAALFAMDRRREAELRRTNVEGSRIVLETAARMGLDPIVYVSSIAALFPPDGDRMHEEVTVKSPTDMYARTKAAAETNARSLQEDGHPITIVYPGAIWGPHDPTLGDGVRTLLSFIRAGVLPATVGGFPCVDARDLGRLHVAAMQPEKGPRRYMAGGSFLSLNELRDVFSEITGRRFRMIPTPAPALRAIGRAVDWVEQRTGFRAGPSHEAMVTLTCGVPSDNSRLERELGLTLRPAAETFADTLAWLHESGQLSARTVGRLAHSSRQS